MLPRIARLLAPYKGSLILVALAVVVAAALTSVAPFLTKAVFDKALFPPGGPDLTLLTWLTLGLIAIPLLAALIGIGQNYLTSKVGNSAMADLRGNLFEHLQRMELAFFTATKTGAIQSRLANDVNGVRTVLTSTATTILSNVVTVGAALVSMILLSWQLTIITLILMPLFVLVQVRVGRRRQRLARKTQESLSEMTAITEESLSVSGILLAKVFNRADLESRRYRRENRRQTRLQVKATMTGQTFFALVSTFFAITPAIIYFVAGRMLGNGAALTAGTLVAFTTLQARLQGPLMQLMRVSLDVQTSLALFRRIFEYLDLVPAVQDRPDARPLPAADLRGEVTCGSGTRRRGNCPSRPAGDASTPAGPPPPRSWTRAPTAACPRMPSPRRPPRSKIPLGSGIPPESWTKIRVMSLIPTRSARARARRGKLGTRWASWARRWRRASRSVAGGRCAG